MRRIPTILAAYFVLAVGAFISIFPYLWAVLTSLKPESEVFTSHFLSLPTHIEWANYTHVFQQINMGRYLLNTVIVAVASVLGQLIFGSMAAYGFSRFNFKGKNVIFML